VPGAEFAEMKYLSAHPLEQRARALEVFDRAAGHEHQFGCLRAPLRSRDRRVEHRDAARL
jgi:hypothetical protein